MRAIAVLCFAIVSLQSAQAQQTVTSGQTTLAFHDVDVFDGTRMNRHVNVIVEAGMIRHVGASVPIPPQSTVIEGDGYTLLPGLIDSHTHLGEKLVPEFLRDALDFGVTTELEMGGSAASLRVRRDSCRDCANFLTAGTVVTVPGGHPTEMPATPQPTLSPTDDVQAFVDKRILEGSDYIKLIDEHQLPTLSTSQIENIVVAAHRRNKLAIAHIGSQKEAMECIEAGVDALAHVFADSQPAADFGRRVAEHHAFVITTLTVFESLTAGSEPRWWQKEEGLSARLTPTMRNMLGIRLPKAAGLHLAFAEQAVARLHEAGVSILAGTDSPVPGIAHGVSLHRELELLVESGLSPSEALTATTFTPAREFGLHDRGRVAEGFRADLLLVKGDPTSDIRALHGIEGVWLGGERHSASPEGQTEH
ncbi:MAG: amidohydrolase family protein [Edaphobacter sp.]|uniref:amidohydrolase family protein n=1 Tax=Edaphobacter sp. TaxID=1934404 RepID=UPI0023A74F6A|nr:amidohydrolase family protein [Edaphobacter sp.]MDE1178534.1 amidohydrolase family protein [Edaphobacter sp.]